MRKLTFALLMFVAAAAAAAELFPVANTRYGAAQGEAILRTNGTDPVVFWRTDPGVRATKVVEGQNRAGEPIFDDLWIDDVVWTGNGFLAVATQYVQSQPRIVGRHLDANGRPAGAVFVVVSDGLEARLAVGHGSVLMVHRTKSSETRAVRLRADGRASTDAVTITTTQARHAVAATASGFVAITWELEELTATRLDPAARIAGRQTMTRPDNTFALTVVSEGARTLVVRTLTQGLEALPIGTNGTFGAPLLVDTAPPELSFPIPASPVWNGNGWSVAYTIGGTEPRVRVAHLDAAAQRVMSREESPAGRRNPSLAVIGGKVVSTWSTHSDDPAWIGALPLPSDDARPVTFGAASQGLAATAASDDAVLAVWAESSDRRVTLRAGVRTRDGQWSEHEIPGTTQSYIVSAASDGDGFIVIVAGPRNTSEAIFLDESGRPTGQRVQVPAEVHAVAWNGSRYALVQADDDARLLSPDGTISAPIDLGVSWAGMNIVSNGDGFLVIGIGPDCLYWPCHTLAPRALRLDANLQRVGEELQLDRPYDDSIPGVVWTGTEYVVVWNGEAGAGFARISPDPSIEPRTLRVPIPMFAAAVAPANGGVAVLDIRNFAHEVKFFTSGGALVRTEGIEGALRQGRPQLVPFGDAVAYVASPILGEAPHYGTRRVSMAILANADAEAPAAPQLTVRGESSRFVLEWTAPFEAVNGYRVESRVDDGAWIELERWFTAGDTTIGIRRPSFGTAFTFRVRAFNDAGASPYSNQAAVRPRKMRAVR
jgi:hypothetical protein